MAKMSPKRFENDILRYKRLGLDSMCFIYQFSDDPDLAPLTHVLFSLLEKRKITAVTSTVSVVESFVQPERSQNALILSEYEKVFTHLPNLEVITVDWYVARLAAKLRASYKSLRTPDAIQLAATLLKGYKAFLTNDAKLKQIKEIKILTLKDYII